MAPTSAPTIAASVSPMRSPVPLVGEEQPTSTSTPSSCAVTRPNGDSPPGERPSPNWYGDGKGMLWATLWPTGVVRIATNQVRADGSLGMKFGWWRGAVGQLAITGRRLDALAPPMRADIPDGYGDHGFQSTGLIFPTEGCWEVTGSVGDARLSFVTRVIKAPSGTSPT